jgi:hypothetical protein
LLSFSLRGLDTDNGVEFLNDELLGYCEREGITFTRRRGCRKKQWDGSTLHRRYDQAQTPWQRLLASGVLDEARTARLAAIFQALDPVRLRRQLEALLDAL